MAGYRYTFVKFIRDWMLIFGMVAGAGAYLLYHAIPSLHGAGPVLEAVCTHLQPVLLFIMLFLSFCKIEPHQMRPHRWQAWLLLIQAGTFTALALLLSSSASEMLEQLSSIACGPSFTFSARFFCSWNTAAPTLTGA